MEGKNDGRWVAEFDDPRGRGIDSQPFQFIGTHEEALAYARTLYWYPDGVTVYTLDDWFEAAASELDEK